MNNDDEAFRSRISESLGASRVIALANLPSSGPLDLLALRAEVGRRLKSSGGRPTDPSWEMQRLVPFRGESWKQLEDLATGLSADGRRVSAGQLAAILLERVLEQIQVSTRNR